MLSARRRLDPLLALAGEERLPTVLRDELRSALESLVASAQQSLDDSAGRGPDATTRLAAVRENDLRRAFGPSPDLPPAPSPAVPVARGRRVIV